MKTAARRKFRRQFEITRLHHGYEIVDDLIRQPFVKYALITIRLEVELQTLEFDALLIRNEREGQRAVVRLSRNGAQRGELRANVRDNVISSGERIVKEDENFRRRLLCYNVWHNDSYILI